MTSDIILIEPSPQSGESIIGSGQSLGMPASEGGGSDSTGSDVLKGLQVEGRCPSEPDSSPAQGKILGSRYRLLHVIGRGGMGWVWCAEHVTLGKRVAVKVIQSGIAENPDAVARFQREARAAASLHSPYIVQVHDFGIEDGLAYMAMELLDGETLGALIRRSGPLTPACTADVLGPVSEALHYAHRQGITHRDVKPDNIFLAKQGHNTTPKILDFGIARTARRGAEAELGCTHAGAILGTPLYMSPEQARSLETDHRTDVWALGIVAFECLLGSQPFRGSTLAVLSVAICSGPLPVPSAFGPVPRDFDAWFARCVAREPTERFDSVREAGVQLIRLCRNTGEGSTLDGIGPTRAPMVATDEKPPITLAAEGAPTPPPVSEHSSVKVELHEIPVAADAPALDSSLSRSNAAVGNTMLSDAATSGGTKRDGPRFPPRAENAADAQGPPRPQDAAEEPVSRVRPSLPPQTLLGRVLNNVWRRSQSSVPPADDDEELIHSLRQHQPGDPPELVEFLRAAFGHIEISREDPLVLDLNEVRLPDVGEYRYFAVPIPTNRPLPELGKTAFSTVETALGERFKTLPPSTRKVVLVLSRFIEVGKGFREKVLEYRQNHNALIVPVHIGVISKARRERRLIELFERLVSTFHPSLDPYAASSRDNPAELVGMNRQVTELVGMLHGRHCFVAIHGLPRSGKTSLVGLAEYNTSARFHRIRCVESQAAGIEAITSQVIAALGQLGEPSDLDRAVSTYIQGAASRSETQVLVLEDADWLIAPLSTYDHASQKPRTFQRFWCEIGRLTRSGTPVIVTGIRAFALSRRFFDQWENPIANVIQCVKVPALDLAATERLVTEPTIALNIAVQPRAVRAIYQEAAGNVDLVRRLCREIVLDCERRRGEHVMRRIKVRRAVVERCVERLTHSATTFGDQLLAWLAPVQRDVLRVVACEQPVSMDAVRDALPNHSKDELRSAFDHLEYVGLVEYLGGRHRIAIPILERWARRYFGRDAEDRARIGRRRAWTLVIGVGLTWLLAMFYWLVLDVRFQRTTFRQDHCVVTVTSPTKVKFGAKVPIGVVTQDCDAAALPIRFDAGPDTRPRYFNGDEVEPTIPLTLKCRDTRCSQQLALAFEPGSSNTFRLNLETEKRTLGAVEMGTDWLEAMGGATRRLFAVLSAIPALLALFLGFQQQLRRFIARVVSLGITTARRRRSVSNSGRLTEPPTWSLRPRSRPGPPPSTRHRLRPRPRSW